jgi:hypothetical protein
MPHGVGVEAASLGRDVIGWRQSKLLVKHFEKKLLFGSLQETISLFWQVTLIWMELLHICDSEIKKEAEEIKLQDGQGS